MYIYIYYIHTYTYIYVCNGYRRLSVSQIVAHTSRKSFFRVDLTSDRVMAAWYVAGGYLFHVPTMKPPEKETCIHHKTKAVLCKILQVLYCMPLALQSQAFPLYVSKSKLDGSARESHSISDTLGLKSI